VAMFDAIATMNGRLQPDRTRATSPHGWASCWRGQPRPRVCWTISTRLLDRRSLRAPWSAPSSSGKIAQGILRVGQREVGHVARGQPNLTPGRQTLMLIFEVHHRQRETIQYFMIHASLSACPAEAPCACVHASPVPGARSLCDLCGGRYLLVARCFVCRCVVACCMFGVLASRKPLVVTWGDLAILLIRVCV
jgi:hypothetical protein